MLPQYLNWQIQDTCHARATLTVTTLLIFMISVTYELMISSESQAQSFPSKKITIITTESVGGSFDTVARLLGRDLQNRIKQEVVIESKPGAFGLSAIESIREAQPDGYTLLLTGIVDVIHAQPNLRENLFTLLAPISFVASIPYVLVVPSNSKLSALGDVTTQGSFPKPLRLGVTGYFPTLWARLLQSTSKKAIQLVVLSSTNEVIEDAVAGRIDLAILGYSNVRKLLEDRILRGLATTVTLPSKQLQGIPMIPQSGTSGVQVENFIGVFAPPLVPRDIVLMLNTAISSAISSPRITENLIEMGFVPKVGKSDEFLVAINKSIAAVPDVCKIKSQCEKDKECPRPCPAEKNP